MKHVLEYTMPEQLKQFKVDIPSGESGDWKVEKFEITEAQAKFHNLRQAINSHRGMRPIEAGIYTRITRNGAVIMSDTPSEIEDHLPPIDKATGKILINGLGIGVVLSGCLTKPEVEHATVIELSEDVIKLVGGFYQEKFGDRLTIVNANALEYKPANGIRYGMVWHDIWDNICGDNIPEMKKLKRKYCRKTDWQGCWCEAECKRGRGW